MAALDCWREFRRTEVSSLADLEQVVQSSSAIVNESQLVGSQTGESIVPMRDCAGFLGPQFRRLTGIKWYHHFHFDKNTPGVVHLRFYSNSPEEKQHLVKDQSWKPDASDIPPIISPTGMSLERRQYPFEKIREFCREGTKDLVCPDPGLPTPTPTPPSPPSPSQLPSSQRDPPQHGEGPAPKRSDCFTLQPHNWLF